MLSKIQDQKPALTIFEYNIVMQLLEQHPEDGVPMDTQEWVSEFFEPQTKESLDSHYDGWLNNGYHLVSFDLRQVKAKYEGDPNFYPVWGVTEDEF